LIKTFELNSDISGNPFCTFGYKLKVLLRMMIEHSPVCKLIDWVSEKQCDFMQADEFTYARMISVYNRHLIAWHHTMQRDPQNQQPPTHNHWITLWKF
jgi:hypothetical protein